MGLTAALSKFVIILLCLQVVQSENDWGVTYISSNICALKGTTVTLSCKYTYPSTIDDRDTVVVSTFWFVRDQEPVDLRMLSEYAGRVQHRCDNNTCTLTITDLRNSDSASYKFRLITNQPGGLYTGQQGVKLSVRDLMVKLSSSWKYCQVIPVSCELSKLNYIWYENGKNQSKEKSSISSYSCAVPGYEDFHSPSAYPDIKVEVIWSSTGLRLVCQSSCPGPHTYIWYRNNEKMTRETSFSYSRHVDPDESYSCAIKGYEHHQPPPVYAPKIPEVSVSPSAVVDIMEGSSVSLTCSSDANPAAKYAWFNMNNTQLNTGAQLVFVSIQSSDSGGYHCTAENDLGQRTSKEFFIDVQYPPRLPSVFVSPSGQIVEGSSVTLTCTSDANPPVTEYTWYKEDQTLSQGKNNSYSLIRISAEDIGRYYCTSANQHGQMNSTSQFIDVHYPPRLPSVSVSPSGQIVEGSSVTLTCTSDANPPVTEYTWYKEDEDSPKASGPNFTVSDIRSEHSGNYYCEAQNSRGRQNSTSHLIVVAGSVRSSVAGTITALFLAVTLLAIFLWVRRKGVFKQQLKPRETQERRTQLSAHVDDSAVAQRQPAEQHDDLHYSIIHFSKNQDDALYSNIRPAQPHRPEDKEEEEEEEVEDVVYTTVKFVNASSSPRTNHQEAAEDPCTIYSVVNKQ